jgi:hypothetical protein
MRLAFIDPTPKTRRERLYPIGLLRLGAWRRQLGDEVELFTDRLPAAGKFEEAWISVAFTYHIPRVLSMIEQLRERVGRVLVGGPAATLLPDYFTKAGAEVHSGIVPEAEPLAPAYDLLGHDPAYSIARVTRGCPRACEFCAVSTIEGKFSLRAEWVQDLDSRAKRVLFYDDNVLALPPRKLAPEISKMKHLAKLGAVQSFDFNQGLDARLVGECDGKEAAGALEKCDLFAGVPLDPVRFAFDGMQEEGYLQSAIRRFAARGHRVFRCYVIFNFEDTPRNFYYRLRELQRVADELNASPTVGARVQCESFPMRYSPIDQVGRDRRYVGRNWSAQALRGFRTLLTRHSATGLISCMSLEEFEYWFGCDADAFVQLIRYPKIKELAERRRFFLRDMRRRLRAEGFVSSEMVAESLRPILAERSRGQADA